MYLCGCSGLSFTHRLALLDGYQQCMGYVPLSAIRAVPVSSHGTTLYFRVWVQSEMCLPDGDRTSVNPVDAGRGRRPRHPTRIERQARPQRLFDPPQEHHHQAGAHFTAAWQRARESEALKMTSTPTVLVEMLATYIGPYISLCATIYINFAKIAFSHTSTMAIAGHRLQNHKERDTSEPGGPAAALTQGIMPGGISETMLPRSTYF